MLVAALEAGIGIADAKEMTYPALVRVLIARVEAMAPKDDAAETVKTGTSADMMKMLGG